MQWRKRGLGFKDEAMKLILLFDSDKLGNCYREYELDYDKQLRAGGAVSVSFCHPDHGEVMQAKAHDELSEIIPCS